MAFSFPQQAEFCAVKIGKLSWKIGVQQKLPKSENASEFVKKCNRILRNALQNALGNLVKLSLNNRNII